MTVGYWLQHLCNVYSAPSQVNFMMENPATKTFCLLLFNNNV